MQRLIGDTVIITGGHITSTEIINIRKKTIKFGGDLSPGRHGPTLVTLNKMLYAI